LGCPILERIIPNMLENAFRIAIDPLFPPPSQFSYNHKYNIAENAVNYNKFELIFD
jgi:tubulin--tyrosine ligase